MPTLSVKDFSGGITDQIEDAPSNYAEEMDNLLISVDGHLFSRPGSRVFFSGDTHPGAGNRVDSLIPFLGDTSVTNFIGQGNLFALVESVPDGWMSLFRINGTGDGFTQITGYGVNGCLDGDSTCQTSFTQWNNHLLITNDAYFVNSSWSSPPAKIYKDSGGTYRLVTAGLPMMADVASVSESTGTANLVSAVNDMRTKLLAHFATTAGTVHTAADTTAAALITSGAATNLATAITLLYQLLQAYNAHHFDSTQNTPSFHVRPIPVNNTYGETYALESGTKPLSLEEATTKAIDLANKFTQHLQDAGTVKDLHTGTDAGNIPTAVTRYITYPTYDTYDQSYNQLLTASHPVCILLSQFITTWNKHITDGAVNRHTTANQLAFTTALTYTSLENLVRIMNSLAEQSWGGAADGVGGNGSNGHMADALLAAAFDYHNATGSNRHLTGYNTVTGAAAYAPTYLRLWEATLQNVITKLEEFISKYNLHEAETTPHNGTASDDQFNNIPTYTTGRYLYAFCYKYEYTVGNLTFIDRGPLKTMTVEEYVDPSQYRVNITNIQTLANSGLTNYDTANIDIEIYRTVKNGTNYYLVDTIDNGTTSYLDRVSDAELVTREELYTNGGVVENDSPPQCKFVHVAGDKAYYGFVKEGADIFPNRIRQSIPGDIDAVPGDFYEDVDDTLMGLSSVNSKVIALGAANIYRLEGSFDLRGQGSMSYERISDATGAINNVGCVQTEDALFFLGNDGVYMTDGYKVQKLSDHLNTTYAALTNTATKRRRMVGCYDKGRKLVIWTCQQASGGSDNDTWLILDLKRPLTRTSVFTTASGGTNFAPTSVAYFNNQIIRGEALGSVLKHDDTYLSDPKISSGTPSAVTMKPVIYNYKTPHWGFGNTGAKKWAADIEVDAKNVSHLSLQIKSINDGGRKQYDLKQIHFRGNLVWDSADLLWGDTSLTWDNHGYIRERRRFASTHLRFDYKQLIFTNAYTIIVNSDTLGTGVVDSGAKTVTISGAGDWPTDVLDYYICFENDNYTTQLLVTVRNSAKIITFTGTSPASGTYKWLLKGYPKEERLYLIGYTIPYEYVSEPGIDQVSGGQGGNV